MALVGTVVTPGSGAGLAGFGLADAGLADAGHEVEEVVPVAGELPVVPGVVAPTVVAEDVVFAGDVVVVDVAGLDVLLPALAPAGLVPEAPAFVVAAPFVLVELPDAEFDGAGVDATEVDEAVLEDAGVDVAEPAVVGLCVEGPAVPPPILARRCSARVNRFATT